jgi:hypothetical protein
MRLRTLAGGHAGEIEDYRYEVGVHALDAGLAERLDSPRAVQPPPVMAGPVPGRTVQNSSGQRRAAKQRD